MNKSLFVNDINIGLSIRKVISDKEISQAQLVRLLGKSPTYVTRLLKKETIDTDTLCEISKLLDYNFFDDYVPKIVVPEEYYDDYVKSVEEPERRRGFYLTYPHIGNQIIEILKERKVTQSELGEYLGVSHQEVSRLLKNKSIDTGRLAQISHFLKYCFFSFFYRWLMNDDTILANSIDRIMNEYLEDYPPTVSVTGMITDSSTEKFRDTINNMMRLINCLYEENKELRQKLSQAIPDGSH